MKTFFRNTMLVAASLLMALMVQATVIGGDAAGGDDQSSLAGCEDKSSEMRKLNCVSKDGGPAYGCSMTGTLESCTIVQACP